MADGAGREIPVALQRSLQNFRRRARQLKILEASLLAAFGLLVSYLLVFGLDRLLDTPGWARGLLLVAGVVGLLLVLPAQLYRWVWGTRTLEQVARVVGRKDANAGDRLLSAVELTRNDAEFERSPVLCEAAIHQVDEEFRDHAPDAALPDSRHRTWGKAVLVPLAACAVLVALVPAAAGNAVMRWMAPFGDTARFTFARVATLPNSLVVAKGEPVEFVVALDANSDWRPSRAAVRMGQDELAADLADGSYKFRLPPQTTSSEICVGVGDFRQAMEIRPVDRPAIATLDAAIHLPEYMGIAEPRPMDGRAGALSVVEGSRVDVTATTTRDLKSVRADGQPVAVSGREFRLPEIQADKSRDVVLDWTDVHGLSGQEPMTLAVRAHEDRAPTVYLEGLKNETVLLVTDTLTFKVHGGDDFGVRRMGLSWEGIPDSLVNPKPVKGEKLLLVAEDGKQEKLSADAAFCPEMLGVPAQPLRLCAWVEDALPGRERVCSTAMTVFVMTPEEHMIWLTKQLAVWDDEAREVHERELALHDENLALRALPGAELARPANLRRLEMQARAERANGQRLSSLITSGQSLLAQAARNPEFNETMLDRWASMMSALKDMAESRMPSIADLLTAAASGSKSAPSAGVNRLGPQAGTAPQTENINKLPGNPSVVDTESTMLTGDENKEKKAAGAGGGKVNLAPPPLRLAGTMLAGKSGGGGACAGDPNMTDDTTPEALAKAIEEQKKLLEEFARLQGQISEVLAALTGSTFVKRLKAESRDQAAVTGLLRDDAFGGFGGSAGPAKSGGGGGGGGEPATAGVTEREKRASVQVSVIQDDLAAFVDRLQGQETQKKFKTVLDEMRTASPSVAIADVGNDFVAKLAGEALVGTEFWSDKLDYWAELLVGPG